MSLRKTAGLLAAFGLMVGLIGGGVGASFFDTVTADETIKVGSFACIITDATAGATIAPDQKSVSYTAPTINSSAPGSAPFYFQVKNDGTITARLTVTESPALSAPWSYIGMPIADVTLAAGATHNYNTGVQWAALSNDDLGDSGTVMWTVNCGEVPAPVTYVSVEFEFGDGGWAGWSCGAGETIVSATYQVISGDASYNVGLAKPLETTDGYTYPTYPHYTYNQLAGEQGGVLHNVVNGSGGVATLTIVCQP